MVESNISQEIWSMARVLTDDGVSNRAKEIRIFPSL